MPLLPHAREAHARRGKRNYRVGYIHAASEAYAARTRKPLEAGGGSGALRVHVPRALEAPVGGA